MIRFMRPPLSWLSIAAVLSCLGACSSGGGGDDLPGSGPHYVAYEVDGGSGIIKTATISYTDETGEEHTMEHTSLNWSYSFRAEPDTPLSLGAEIEGEGVSTLIITIKVDDACWVDSRTFVAGSWVSLTGTPGEIMETCPNHFGTTAGQ
jgi:hypothetical protein